MQTTASNCPAQREREEAVGGERAARVDAAPARRAHGRGDDANLLVAEHALLAGVRVEAGDAEARAGDAELRAQRARRR